MVHMWFYCVFPIFIILLYLSFTEFYFRFFLVNFPYYSTQQTKISTRQHFKLRHVYVVRWANQGLEFLLVACEPRVLATLTDHEFGVSCHPC